MTAPSSVDVIRTFTDALTPPARAHLRTTNGYDQIRLIHAATQTQTPQQLAKTISKGISWRSPANAPALLMWRLRRAAGEHEDQEDTH